MGELLPFRVPPGTPVRNLVIAWDTNWCPECGSQWIAEDARCCGEACLPVRMEMHSREPL